MHASTAATTMTTAATTVALPEMMIPQLDVRADPETWLLYNLGAVSAAAVFRRYAAAELSSAVHVMVRQRDYNSSTGGSGNEVWVRLTMPQLQQQQLTCFRGLKAEYKALADEGRRVAILGAPAAHFWLNTAPLPVIDAFAWGHLNGHHQLLAFQFPPHTGRRMAGISKEYYSKVCAWMGGVTFAVIHLLPYRILPGLGPIGPPAAWALPPPGRHGASGDYVLNLAVGQDARDAVRANDPANANVRVVGDGAAAAPRAASSSSSLATAAAATTSLVALAAQAERAGPAGGSEGDDDGGGGGGGGAGGGAGAITEQQPAMQRRSKRQRTATAAHTPTRHSVRLQVRAADALSGIKLRSGRELVE